MSAHMHPIKTVYVHNICHTVYSLAKECASNKGLAVCAEVNSMLVYIPICTSLELHMMSMFSVLL